MAIITLASNSRLRTALLIGGACLILVGVILTHPLRLNGWGFLTIWAGLVLVLNRLNALIAILAGLVLSLLPFAIAMQPQVEEEKRQKALEEKRAEKLRAEELRRAEDAVVASFSEKRVQYEAQLTELETLVSRRDWPGAGVALGHIERALTPMFTSRIANGPEVQAMKGRMEKARAILAPKLVELRQAQQRERARAAVAADFERLRTLLRAYKSNEVAADEAYKGRSMRVSGVVGDIKKDILSRPYVTLGTGAEFEIPRVQCFLAPSAISRAASLAPGQIASLEGKVDGLMMNVLLSDCTIQ